MTEDHPSIDSLADLDAGVLSTAHEATVRTHASGCAECSAVLVSLAEVRGILAAEPTEPMPVDVVARIDQALVDERSTATVAQLSPRRRWLKPLAAAAVTIGALSLAASYWNTGGDGADTAASDSAADSAPSRSEDPRRAPDPQGLTGGKVRGRVPALTSAHFDAQVAELAPPLAATLGQEGFALEKLRGGAACPNASWFSGVRRIVLDGRPAVLAYVSGADGVTAVAYRCSAGVADVLAQAPLGKE